MTLNSYHHHVTIMSQLCAVNIMFVDNLAISMASSEIILTYFIAVHVYIDQGLYHKKEIMCTYFKGGEIYPINQRKVHKNDILICLVPWLMMLSSTFTSRMGLLSDTYNFRLHMRRECFTCHPRKRKPLVSYPSMHHGTYVTAI